MRSRTKWAVPPSALARVSSADQKADLDRQLARLTEYAVAHKLPIVDAVKEVGSGLNGHRKGMGEAAAQFCGPTDCRGTPRPDSCDSGSNTWRPPWQHKGVVFGVIEADEVADDIVRDLHEVIVSMCARLYGKRSAKNRAQKALDALQARRGP
jgi:predicted site-specific integrase-resolvase